jgi:hypothetical protein
MTLGPSSPTRPCHPRQRPTTPSRNGARADPARTNEGGDRPARQTGPVMNLSEQICDQCGKPIRPDGGVVVLRNSGSEVYESIYCSPTCAQATPNQHSITA